MSDKTGEYEESKELEQIARNIFDNLAHKLDLTVDPEMIQFLFCKKNSSWEGKASRVSGVLKHFLPNKLFLILVNKQLWETLDDAQKYYLIAHEMKHCAIDEDDKPFLEEHDFEDFSVLMPNAKEDFSIFKGLIKK